MNQEVQAAIRPMIGKACCRARVGSPRSLSIGFGKRLPHGHRRLGDSYYGEWEIGTYYGSWRIIKEGVIICGSNDTDGCEDLSRRLMALEFGRILSVRNVDAYDISAEFDSGIVVNFLATSSDEDERFHIFCPDSIYVEFSVGGVWRIGKSNAPWEGR